MCRVRWRHAGSGAVKVLGHGPVYTYLTEFVKPHSTGGFYLALLDFYSAFCSISTPIPTTRAELEHAKFVMSSISTPKLALLKLTSETTIRKKCNLGENDRVWRAFRRI